MDGLSDIVGDILDPAQDQATDDGGGPAPEDGGESAPADGGQADPGDGGTRAARIADYRALADARLVERDRELYRLREEVRQLRERPEPTDVRELARRDVRGALDHIGLSLESVLSAYSGAAAEPDPELPRAAAERIARLEAQLAEDRQYRAGADRARLRAEIDREASAAISAAGSSAPLSAALGSQAIDLAHRIRGAWLRLHGEIPTYEQLVPLVEEGLAEQYPKVAEAMRARSAASPAAPAAPRSAPRSALAAADRSSGAGAGEAEMTMGEWIRMAAREERVDS